MDKKEALIAEFKEKFYKNKKFKDEISLLKSEEQANEFLREQGLDLDIEDIKKDDELFEDALETVSGGKGVDYKSQKGKIFGSNSTIIYD